MLNYLVDLIYVSTYVEFNLSSKTTGYDKRADDKYSYTMFLLPHVLLPNAKSLVSIVGIWLLKYIEESGLYKNLLDVNNNLPQL